MERLRLVTSIRKEKKTDDCRNEVSPSRFNILSAHEEEEEEIEEANSKRDRR